MYTIFSNNRYTQFLRITHTYPRFRPPHTMSAEILCAHALRVELVLSASNIEELQRDAAGSGTPRPDPAALKAYAETYADCHRVYAENVRRMQSCSGLYLALSGDSPGHLPELCNLVVGALMDAGLTADRIGHTLRLVQSSKVVAQLLVVCLYFGAVPRLQARVAELGPQTATAFAQIKGGVEYIGRMQSQLFEHPHACGLLQWLASVVSFVRADSVHLK